MRNFILSGMDGGGKREPIATIEAADEMAAARMIGCTFGVKVGQTAVLGVSDVTLLHGVLFQAFNEMGQRLSMEMVANKTRYYLSYALEPVPAIRGVGSRRYG